MTQWVGDVVQTTRWQHNGQVKLSLIANNHVTNCLDLLHKIQENLDFIHKIQVIGKHGYFTSKTGSNHTSQDKCLYFLTTWTIAIERCLITWNIKSVIVFLILKPIMSTITTCRHSSLTLCNLCYLCPIFHVLSFYSQMT